VFALTMLAERRAADVLPDSMVFPNSRGHGLGRGSWRDPHNTGARLRTALDLAGFEWVTSHVFRKTAATVLDQHGLSARAIAGHIGTPALDHAGRLRGQAGRRPRGR
jgi:integrase